MRGNSLFSDGIMDKIQDVFFIQGAVKKESAHFCALFDFLAPQGLAG